MANNMTLEKNNEVFDLIRRINEKAGLASTAMWDTQADKVVLAMINVTMDSLGWAKEFAHTLWAVEKETLLQERADTIKLLNEDVVKLSKRITELQKQLDEQGRETEHWQKVAYTRAQCEDSLHEQVTQQQARIERLRRGLMKVETSVTGLREMTVSKLPLYEYLGELRDYLHHQLSEQDDFTALSAALDAAEKKGRELTLHDVRNRLMEKQRNGEASFSEICVASSMVTEMIGDGPVDEDGTDPTPHIDPLEAFTEDLKNIDLRMPGEGEVDEIGAVDGDNLDAPVPQDIKVATTMDEIPGEGMPSVANPVRELAKLYQYHDEHEMPSLMERRKTTFGDGVISFKLSPDKAREFRELLAKNTPGRVEILRADRNEAMDDSLAMSTPGYERLANVLHRAFNQAAHGKGKERHARGEPFHEQIMQIGARLFGVGGLYFQAMKKCDESQRLPPDAAIRELLGAINYIAGAVIRIEDDAAEQSEEESDGAL